MLTFIISSLILAQKPATSTAKPKEDFTLAALFPERPYTGKGARGVEWSGDDKCFAYLWNPFEDRAFDIWCYDVSTGKTRRITSVEIMADFDKDAAKAAEAAKNRKKDDKDDDGGQAPTDEDGADPQGGRGQGQRQGTGRPTYAGISSFEWSHHGEEMLFTYKGDIFRLKMDGSKPVRLTKTTEPESNIQYTKDDGGFFYRRGNGVFRMRFDSPVVEQLNPELPQGMQMGGYSISPDESKIMISSGRAPEAARQVTYLSYRNRFAEAKTTERGVADDKFNDESYLYLYDLNDDPKDTKKDNKPWQIYFWPAGKEYGQTSLGDPAWSPDSKKFVFSTWKRDKREIEIDVADMDSHKVESVYKTTHNGGSNTPGMIRPEWTGDGRIAAMLETSGYRHVWIIDPAKKDATQLTKGDYEVYPDEVLKDGKTLLVHADKEDSSRNDYYTVNIDSGEMKRLTSKSGSYGSATPSHDGKLVVASFGSWDSGLSEYYLLDGKNETQFTNSHPDTWAKLYKIHPKKFSFKNRVGDTINGFMYLPLNYKKGEHRPLFMYTYGGPLGTSKNVVEGSNEKFNMYLAYKYGYITCTIDPRGMSGYGGAFESANWEKPGKAQVDDLSDAVRYMVENYGIDQKKVGINGWSFGGFQTQMCMYTAPDVFTLGIAGAGPTEWQNYNTWYTGGVIGYSSLGKPEDLDKFSLTKLAKNLKGPLMLLHGMEDTNVLFQDTVHVYQALLRAGKGPLIELVLDPTGSHGLGGDIKTKDRYEIYEAFLMNHWGPYKK